ncbi:MAG: M23 family metallopeptidase [Bacillota bacterium]|nr:M23 family metallopeptidase [Bacillota bacterium]
MGSYEPYYKNYYNKIKTSKGRSLPSFSMNKLFNKIIFQLAGTLILIIFILICRSGYFSSTDKMYEYAKKTVNTSFDYMGLYNNIKGTDIKTLPASIWNKINVFKDKVEETDKVKEYVKENFQAPIEGKITSKYGNRADPVDGGDEGHDGVDISCALNTDVAASFSGTIKETAEDADFGKYIVIDHGDGIETRYGHLNSFLVDKGVTVEKGDIIGKSGNTGKVTGPHLHFSLSVMGTYKNPEEYITFKE